MVWQGGIARRESWQPCRYLRPWKDGDTEYIPGDFPKETVIIDDCKKDCDCEVTIFIPTPEDELAEDWVGPF